MTRTFSIGFFGAVAAHIVVLVVTRLILSGNEDVAWRFPVALAPMFPFLIILLMLVSQLRRQADELERRVMLEAPGDLILRDDDRDIRLRPPSACRYAGLQRALGRRIDDGTLVRRNGHRQEAVPVRNRLRVIRAERRWSQKDLADLLEVSRQTVNAIETGKYAPSLTLAFKIARLVGQPIEDIFDPE